MNKELDELNKLEKIKKYRKNYYQKNKKKISDYQKEYYQKKKKNNAPKLVYAWKGEKLKKGMTITHGKFVVSFD